MSRKWKKKIIVIVWHASVNGQYYMIFNIGSIFLYDTIWMLHIEKNVCEIHIALMLNT